MKTECTPNEARVIDCDVCLAEIPSGGGISAEGDDYVFHFCGIACYQKWKEQGAALTDDD